MSDDMKEKPAVPDGWIEFEYSDPDPDAVAEELQKQQRHKLHKPVESGVDEERGPYDVIPLAMVLGGEAKPTTVFKTPMKHMVLDQGIPPRGWYKSKIESDRVRPRPCYVESILTSPFLGYCPVGCSTLKDTMISTPNGLKPIQDFQVGDVVYGRFDWGIDLAEVLATTQHKSPGYYHVKLSDGQELNITAGHLVWVLGQGWMDIKDLYDAYGEAKFESLQDVRSTYALEGQNVLRRMFAHSSQRSIQEEWHKSKTNAGIQAENQQYFEGQRLEAYGGVQTGTQPAYEGEQLQSAIQEGQAFVGEEQTRYSEGGHRQTSFGGETAENKPDFDWSQDAYGSKNSFGQSYVEQGNNQIQVLEEAEVLCQGWKGDTMPVVLGVQGGGVSGQQEHKLALRSGADSAWGRSVLTRLFPIFQAWQIAQDYRGERLVSEGGSRENVEICGAFNCPGHTFGNMGKVETEGIEYTLGDVNIISMEYVEGEVDVYDIQTISENFYASGILLHNSFCYINNGSRGYRATGLPTVDPGYPEKFSKQLKRMMVAGAGYMTSFSEAFHKLEDTYHVTERLTQVFVDEGLPIFYCTRRIPMEFAVEALQKNPYSYCQFSINTSNPDDYRKLSPGAAKLEEYYKMINRLHNLGVYVSIQCNPIHPGITSLEELKQLVRELASVGTDHIIFKFVEQVMNTRKVIVDRLVSRRFDPKKVDLFDKLFNQVIGGVYTIQQDVRIEWLEELLAETRANHMTMSTCYEYYENGKAGANLAPYFTTSDQCHGRGVPIHYRPAPGEKFVPLPGCYRKGCLYCADHGTRACRSETLLEAKALEYKDLVSTVITGRDEDWDMAESCARPEMEHANPNANPGYMTDAELWGWIPRYTPEDKIGQFVPAQEQHSGSKDVLDRAEYEQHI